MSSTSRTTSTGTKKDWRHKIATNRGSTWHKNMLAGRRDASLNPSLMRLHRIKKNVYQADIAKRLDVSESTLGAIERGKRPVKADLANQIAKELGLPVEKLFCSVNTTKLLKNPRKKRSKKLVAIIHKSAV